MTDTLFQLCKLHLCGYYPVLYSSFSLGQLGTNHRVQSHGPIPGSFLFKYCCDVQDGKLPHPLLKRGLPPPLCLWVITPPEVADEVVHSGSLARTCPGMPARYDSYRSAYNQFTVFFLPQSCTLLSSLQSTVVSLSYQSKCRSFMHTLNLSITHFKVPISVSKKS